jgi:hypothetical protein
VDNGVLKIVTGLALVEPAEFVIVTIQQIVGQSLRDRFLLQLLNSPAERPGPIIFYGAYHISTLTRNKDLRVGF